MIENNVTAMKQFYQNVNTDNKTREDQNSREVEKTDESQKSVSEEAYKLSESLSEKANRLYEEIRETKDQNDIDFTELDKQKLEGIKNSIDLDKIDYQKATHLLR